VLKLSAVEVKYGGAIQALHGVSMEVSEGQMVALLGANGAGKTTTLRAISGMLRPQDGAVTAGEIEFDGVKIEGKSPEEVVRMGIVQVLEGHRTLTSFTVAENLSIGAHLRKDRAGIKSDMELMYDYFPKLKSRRAELAGYLSGGEQQMLVIGRALMARPKVMLLDELSLGLAPLVIQDILRAIRRINAESKTSILLVEQNAKAALSVASYGYVMEVGRIAVEGPTEMLKDNDRVKESYLGVSRSGDEATRAENA